MVFEVMRTTTGRDKKPIENCFPLKLVSTLKGRELNCWELELRRSKN